MPRRARHAACLPVAVALAWGATALPGRADVVAIAPSSYAAFSVRLLWFRHVRGRFEALRGNLDWSPRLRQGVVHAWIDVHSARMRQPRFRGMLLGPAFLDAANHPRIRFVSAPVGPYLLRHGGTLRGLLDMHGVSRPVMFSVQPSRCLRPETTPCTLRLHGSVRRSRFGITGHGTLVSDQVQLNLVIRLTPR